jgi:preprotein translocase subunit YajC
MSDWLAALVLFADEAAPAQNAAPRAVDPLATFMLPLLLIAMLAMFMFTGPGAQRRREQKRVNELLTTLKKNDPVVTIGGIFGTVVSVAPEKREVVIKVDDTTRLRMQASSVHPAGQRDEKSEPSKD